MKTRLAILILFLAAVSHAGTSTIRHFFLPLWFEGEATQTCQLRLKEIEGPLARIGHNCSVTMEHDIIGVTNGLANVTFTVDVKKARAEREFTLQVFGFDAQGNLSNLEQNWVCHPSFVPFKQQVTTQGSRFALTNLTSQPFVLERSGKAVIEEASPTVIRGTFEEGASLRLRGQEKIRLNRNPDEE